VESSSFSPIKSSETKPVAQSRIGPGRSKDVYDLLMTTDDRQYQRRLAAATAAIHVNAPRDQSSNCLSVTIGSRTNQQWLG
jgi:hypothetical protein